ncbi:MAG: methyltransferase domain-containing protein [Chloroflexi bacterium]|nr:methyltransferase domain-containing protein [Chloroflexota bacterium]MCI0578388.1 methyltransferase domain-containing protein [Chloroflexota bacterium]MCI0647615.1 methyltransferase domain-containing protein [Chloroflexota bacterium]MCI0730416.1 methyltransferase domain-containing protein [Chloroflexota bacterium]
MTGRPMAALTFCCPRCKGSLESFTGRYECRACPAVYPIIAGIPDFRLYSDPYISLEADREKGLRLAAEAGRLDFPALVARYYAITPEVLPQQARRFTAHHLAGVQRGNSILARLAAYGLAANGPVLDLGCGTAGFVAAAAAAGHEVVGVDIAFRWLVIGRRRLAGLGYEALPLVCACADHLPFPDGRFSLVVAENLLEHVPSVAAVLAEAGRVCAPGGGLLARTVNRFAPGPEPHVGVWGLGFLPRRWMDPAVRRLKGIPYEHIHLQSALSLGRLLRALGQPDLALRPPLLSPAELAYLPPGQQRLLVWYGRLVGLGPPWQPLLWPLLTLFGPYLDVIARTAAPLRS